MKALVSNTDIHQRLTDLELQENPIGAAGAKTISTLLTKCPLLRRLILRHCELCDVQPPGYDAAPHNYDGFRAICTAVRSHASLKSLDLCYNELDEECAKALADALEANNSLTDLDVRNNKKIKHVGADRLAAVVFGHNSIALFNAIPCNIQDSEYLDWGKVTLPVWDLSKELIGSVGARVVASILQLPGRPNDLRKIRVDDYELILTERAPSDPDTTSAVTFDAIGENIYFTDGRFDPQFCDLSAIVFASQLKDYVNLETLNLAYGKIGDDGAQALVTAAIALANQHKKLRALNMSSNLISTLGAEGLQEQLKSALTITEINFKHNPYRWKPTSQFVEYDWKTRHPDFQPEQK